MTLGSAVGAEPYADGHQREERPDQQHGSFLHALITHMARLERDAAGFDRDQGTR